MPRTEGPKKRGVRFCGDCGYELARDNDGPCPMCRRFEQVRLDFIVPRPSDLTTRRPGSDTDVGVVPDEPPPTVEEYRAILAERRLRSAALGQDAATVIRTPALKQRRVPPRTHSEQNGDRASAPPAEPTPMAKNLASTPPTKAKARRDQGKKRRATHARDRSSRAAETTNPTATASSSAPVESGDVAATPSSSSPRSSPPPKAAGAPSGTAAASGSEPLALPRQSTRPLMQAGPVRQRALRSRPVVSFSSVIIVVIVLVASALIGTAVAMLLSLR